MSANYLLDVITNDFAFGDRANFQFTVDKAEWVTQKITNRLQWFYAEWFLDRTGGLPYFQEILNKLTDPKIISGYFRQTILQTEGVKGLVSFQVAFDASTRTYTVAFQAELDSGETLEPTEIQL